MRGSIARTMRSVVAISLFPSVLLALGRSPVANGDTAAGKAVHEEHCLKCHGEKGKGDGASAKKLKLKMVDWTNKPHMAKLTDDYLTKITAEGGGAVGKSKVMTPYKDKLSAKEIADVVTFIRSLSQ
jgi:mono/diheme cytochrome c family protein